MVTSYVFFFPFRLVWRLVIHVQKLLSHRLGKKGAGLFDFCLLICFYTVFVYNL